MRQQVVKTTKRMTLLFLCGMTGMLLIYLSYMLPVARIRNHVKSGADILLQETAMYQYADGYVSAILDNSTDDLMLAKTVYQSGDPLLDAVWAPNYAIPGQDAGGLILFETLNSNDLSKAQIDVYPIYWHGYLVLLKPLFLILTYADFRILNQILEFGLMLLLLFLMQKRGLSRYIPACAAMLAFWNPATMGVSLQYAACFYLSIGASVLLFRKQRDSLLFFMLIGALTSFLDFLTYPLVTLCVPLITTILLKSAERFSCRNISVVRSGIGDLFGKAVWWGIGYAGMWAQKWIYGSIVSKKNILVEASGKIGKNGFYVELIIISLLPMLWFCFTANHSHMHPRLVYRTLGVSVYAGMVVITDLFFYLSKKNRR